MQQCRVGESRELKKGRELRGKKRDGDARRAEEVVAARKTRERRGSGRGGSENETARDERDRCRSANGRGMSQ